MVLLKQMYQKSIFLNIDKCDRFSLSYERNRWHSDKYYGYKIKKEDFEKNAKVLYLNADRANNVNYFHYKFLKQIYVLYLFLIKIESNLLLFKDDNT